MSKPNIYYHGVFPATLKSLRQKDGRYFLTLELTHFDITTNLKIDIHDSLCETAGISKLSPTFISKLFSNMPRTILVSNKNGYWKIENESQLLSDIISKSL